jgi:hypothetical protein
MIITNNFNTNTGRERPATSSGIQNIKNIFNNLTVRKGNKNNNTISKKTTQITETSFESKLQILRSSLNELKVDWRDAHANLELNRDNLLKESMKQIENIDLYMVSFINYINI